MGCFWKGKCGWILFDRLLPTSDILGGMHQESDWRTCSVRVGHCDTLPVRGCAPFISYLVSHHSVNWFEEAGWCGLLCDMMPSTGDSVGGACAVNSSRPFRYKQINQNLSGDLPWNSTLIFDGLRHTGEFGISSGGTSPEFSTKQQQTMWIFCLCVSTQHPPRSGPQHNNNAMPRFTIRVDYYMQQLLTFQNERDWAAR